MNGVNSIGSVRWTQVTCAQTAQLVRKALKESFPGVTFSVTSRTYSMGAHIVVDWIDGPNESQVERITTKFRGSRFDGMSETTQHYSHTLDGKPVSFINSGASLRRDYSDAQIEAALQRILPTFKKDTGREATGGVAAYRRGAFQSVAYPVMDEYLHTVIARTLYNWTDRLEVCPSATVSRVQFIE
jgi:hypothetical protein